MRKIIAIPALVLAIGECIKWVAAIGCKGGRHCLGLFTYPADGARAYDEAAIRLKGPKAETNVSLGLLPQAPGNDEAVAGSRQGLTVILAGQGGPEEDIMPGRPRRRNSSQKQLSSREYAAVQRLRARLASEQKAADPIVFGSWANPRKKQRARPIPPPAIPFRDSTGEDGPAQP